MNSQVHTRSRLPTRLQKSHELPGGTSDTLRSRPWATRLHRVRAACCRERRLGRLTMDKTRLAIGLVFLAAIGSGIVAGVFFAFSSFVMAALGRISPAQAVAAMNSINVTVINPSFMTAFVGTGVLCLVVGIRSPFLWNHD